MNSDKKIKILIIDDDIAVTRLLSLYLTKESYEVLTADDGQEGIDLIDSFNPNVILLDLNMPHLKGAGVLGALREQTGGKAKIPIIVISGQGDMEPIYEDLVEGFFLKPIDMVELLRKIEKIIEVQSSQSSSPPPEPDNQEETMRKETPLTEEINLNRMEMDLPPLDLKRGSEPSPRIKKILMVENDATFFNKTARIFQAHGYELDRALSQKELLDKIKICRPDFIMVKLWLPEERGDQIILNLQDLLHGRKMSMLLYTKRGDKKAQHLTMKAMRERVYKRSGLEDMVETNNPKDLLKKVQTDY